MSQPNDDDIFDWSWTQIQPKDKFATFTQSSVSKCDIFHHYIDFQGQEFNSQKFNKKANNKLRNKINAQNSRDRKKVQLQQMNKKIKQLQQQNKLLKSQKHCKWCKRPYADIFIHTPKMSYIQNILNYEYEQKGNKLSNNNTKQIMQFEKPSFQQKKNSNNGKIWIAIAILMLVIGLRMHGLQGSKQFRGIEKIEIEKQQTEKWWKSYMHGKQNEQEYIDMKMQFHERKGPQKGQNYKQKQSQDLFRTSIVIQENNRQMISQQEEQFRLHKDFVYSLQAEIQDIGRYI